MGFPNTNSLSKDVFAYNATYTIDIDIIINIVLGCHCPRKRIFVAMHRIELLNGFFKF